jgi:hypothetical protein
MNYFTQNYKNEAKWGKSQKWGKNEARGSKMRQMPHLWGKIATLVRMPIRRMVKKDWIAIRSNGQLRSCSLTNL